MTLIDLGLREVGVHGEIGPEPRRDAVEEIAADLRVVRDPRITSSRERLRGPYQVWLHVEAMPLGHVSNAGHQTGIAHPVQPLVSWPAHPDVLFVLAGNRAAEVEAPRVAIRVEIQRPERNFDLECPPNLAAGRSGVPDPVPLPVVCIARPQCVRHRAQRVHLEPIGGPAIKEGIDGPLELVIGGKVPVPAHLIENQLVRLGIEHRGADVEIVGAEDDANFGLLGRRLAVVRLHLHEVRRRYRAHPDILIESSVERDRLAGAHPHCLHRAALVSRRRSAAGRDLLHGRRGNRPQRLRN